MCVCVCVCVCVYVCLILCDLETSTMRIYLDPKWAAASQKNEWATFFTEPGTKARKDSVASLGRE